MTRILMRAAQDPFATPGATATISQNLIATNTGNLLFSDASYRLLRTSGTEVVTNGPRLNGDDADPARINAEFDHVVLPLANAFRPDFATKWLPVLTRLVEQLDLPVTVLGVGGQAPLDLDTAAMAGIEGQVRAFMSAVLDRGPSVGVRGEFTADYLRSLGFDQVEVIGCPSMFLRGPELSVRPMPQLDEGSRIATSISNWVDGVGRLIDDNLPRYPELVYFAQELRDLELMTWGDTSVARGVATEVPNAVAHPLLADGHTRFHLASEPWLADLAGFDVAIGTRIHATIAALLAGTPAHLICHDSRTLELARYFGIPHTQATALRDGQDLAELAVGDFSELTSGHAARLETLVAFAASHGLATVYDEGEDRGAWFDQQVAQTAYPEPVDLWDGHDDGDLGWRIAWLREAVRAQAGTAATLRREGAAARKQATALAKQVDTLSRDLKEARADLKSLTARVHAAEQVLAIPLSTRVKDGVLRRFGRS